MSSEQRIAALRNRLNTLSQEVSDLKQLRKSAFLAAPPMPQGGAPPMDPAMMQGGAPPMDPAMMQQGGAPPMDPAMMGGAPPMDPAMMQGGMPMDPAAMGGAPPAPPIDPALIDQIIGLLEEMGQKVQQQGQAMEQLQQAITGELQDLGESVAGIEQRLAEADAAAAATKPVDTW